MLNVLRRLFSTQFMVKDELKRDEMIPSKEAYRTSLNIALPAVAEMVSIAVIGMADTAMVGKLGPYAISAVGLTGQPRMIFICVFFALNIGVTAIVSRRKGEGDQESAKLCLRQSLIIGSLLGLVMTVLALALAVPVMGLAGANEDTLIPSVQYFQIINTGLIIQCISMIICAAQRGVGNTKITMNVNISANIINVIFNYLLIEGHFGFPRLEVQGAAIATVLGNAVGMVLAIQSVTGKNTYLHISLRDSWRPDRAMLKLLTKIGGNSMIEQLAMRVGFFTYARVVAGLGTNAFAAHQIAMQLMGLSFTFADGISAATTSLVGQNLGRNRPDLSIMYGKIGQRLAFIVSIFLCMLSFFGRHWFPTLFTENKDIIILTSQLLIILAVVQPIQTSHIVMSGSLRGAGDTKFVAMTMLLTVAILRPVFSFTLAYFVGMGLIGAWIAIVIDQSVRLALLFKRFSDGKWIHIKV